MDDSPSAGLSEVVFEETVSMVTYLAIFVVCDFTHLVFISQITDTSV